MNSQAARDMGSRWNERSLNLRSVREIASARFKTWQRTAVRFGTGVNELFDNIPNYDQGRFLDICKKIAFLYGFFVDLLELASSNPYASQWRELFHGIEERFIDVMQLDVESSNVPIIEVDEPMTEEVVEGAEQRLAGVVPEGAKKEVFRLPERAKLPITAEQKALQEKRRSEAEEVEARLAQRAKQITEMFEQISGTLPRMEQEQRARRWENKEKEVAAASLVTPAGEKQILFVSG